MKLSKHSMFAPPRRESEAPGHQAGAAIIADSALTDVDSTSRRCPGIPAVTWEGSLQAARLGYCPVTPVFCPGYGDTFMEEVDRLIRKGLILPSPDRTINGTVTEWVVNLGTVWGHDESSPMMEEAPFLRLLYHDLQTWGTGYNRHRQMMIDSGLVTAEEVPEIAPEGLEMNVNRVIGVDGAQWSGLHPHRDMRRFNDALVALGTDSVRHAAIRARALTFSAYFRPLGADGKRMNDSGGALSFQLRRSVRQPGDRGIWDCVQADHNTGAWFFPHTVHGVSRMQPGGVRYSFQVFYPARTEWETEILPRIQNGDLAKELAEASRRGRVGWR